MCVHSSAIPGSPNMRKSPFSMIKNQASVTLGHDQKQAGALKRKELLERQVKDFCETIDHG